jgi:hypothetical protein
LHSQSEIATIILIKFNLSAARPRAILLVGGNSLFAAAEFPGRKSFQVCHGGFERSLWSMLDCSGEG